MTSQHNERVEKVIEEFKKEFTYGVLLSASSDLTGGKAIRYRYEDPQKSIDFLRTQLSTLLSEERGEIIKELEKMKFKNVNGNNFRDFDAHNETLDQAILSISKRGK